MQKYKIIKTIGDGSFGIVFKALSSHNQVVAIKKFKQKYKSWDECLDLRQIKSLKKLDHPNIVKLREVILSNNQLYLVFDFVETNLYQMYIRAGESKRTLTESQIRSTFFQITTALAYLHKNGFFHRDLKPENILCYNNEVKICDFGLAREIRSKPPFTDYVSTRWYRAPELLLRSGTYNSPVDIFALACIVIELYQMKPLFPGANDIENMNKVVELLGTPRKEEWPEGYKLAAKISIFFNKFVDYNFPDKKKSELYNLLPDACPQVIELLQAMLSYNSKKRPSAAQILKHSYFDCINPNNYNRPQKAKQADEKSQTKFSFYENKNDVISIPKNIKVQNPKQMEMRRSMIKFGDSSFTSSFHLSKEQKQQRKKQEKQFEAEMGLIDFGASKNKKQSSLKTIQQLGTAKKCQHIYNQQSGKKNKPIKEQDEVAKRFDEMQLILMELQQKSTKKQEQKRMLASNNNGGSSNRMSGIEQGQPQSNCKKKLSSSSAEQSLSGGFVFGGLNGLASNSNLKNLMRYPPPQR